ncbi:helix-turn-helix domain-containing protein [Pannonibacter sp. SL95]|uniref:helix-turn-helix domain-containing protein n=1 Tax=Pannonibacter sp. SL95 TaxID=2995153 RepID=UPI0022765E00|nr:AraC family transcriptional regulator [Pannonibacter sp. SL95]MCY1707267.1 AraC family transcriptional regulator [Pannonibacter sp. SL95]
MSVPAFRHESGLPGLDHVLCSAPPVPHRHASVLDDAVTVFELPAQPHVQEVSAPPLDLDVMIYMLDGMMALARPLSDGLPVRSLRPRTVMFLPAGTATTWQAAQGQAGVVHLHVPRAVRDTWQNGNGTYCACPAANIDDRDLIRSFETIHRVLAQDVPFRRLLLQGLSYMVVGQVQARLHSAQPVSSPSRAMTPGRLRRVRAYVEENLGREVCLEDMAASVGLSASHFARAFRAETGISPYAYVVQARVARVKAELLHSRRTLSEIALDCGFATQSHMTETFRRATGLPPARWLRAQGRNVEVP